MARYKKCSYAIVVYVLTLCWSPTGYSQSVALDIEFNPKRYVSYKVSDSLAIDGHLDEAAWEQALWTDDFVDIQGDKVLQPRFKTNVKMLWNDSYLYIAARLEEPHIWATLKERDAVIFHDNNFEVFVDPDGNTHQYYELEVNVLGTYWDLMLTQPYRDGGKAIDSWDMRELGIGIDINGTLNDPSDTDSGWTVELAIPWKNLEEASADGNKPSIGDQWRINFSRVEWRLDDKNGTYHKRLDESGKSLAEDNWVWSPQGIINMHYPEMWGFVQFAGEDGQVVEFEWNTMEYIKWYLRQLYYRQHEYKKVNGSFASERSFLQTEELFSELNFSELFPGLSLLEVYATSQTFEIRIKNKASGKVWYIREDGHVWSTE